MKHHLIVLIGLCCIANKVFCQSPSASIDSLIKYQIITVKDRPTIEKELEKERHTSYRVVILGGLESILLEKKFHINLHKTGFMFSYGDTVVSKHKRDSINSSLHFLLDKIKRADLLIDRVYTSTLKNIDSGHYFSEFQMIGSLTELSYRLESLAPNKIMPIAEDLHKSGIVSDSSFNKLESDIKENKIESASRLLDYSQLSRTFDLTKYPTDPDLWLERIHRDIASIVPGLNFTDFSYITIPDTSFSVPGVRFKISLTCNGHIYKHTSLPFSTFKKKQEKITPRDIYIEDFYRIFNKILTDQQSSLRLHSVMFGSGTTDDRLSYFSLIALSAEQSGVFMKESNYSYMFISMDGYDSLLTSAKIDSTIAGWKKIGLFKHLSSAEITKAIDDVTAGDPFSTGALLSYFPGVTYNLHDALTIKGNPYEYLLIHFAKITHGAFIPKKLVQSKTSRGITLQYQAGGRIHSYLFPTNYGWTDVKFTAFVKNLSRENNLSGNFYQLKYDDALIYLSKEQYSYAVKYKLLDLEPTIPDPIENRNAKTIH